MFRLNTAIASKFLLPKKRATRLRIQFVTVESETSVSVHGDFVFIQDFQSNLATILLFGDCFNFLKKLLSDALAAEFGVDDQVVNVNQLSRGKR